ncbi:hypothetical protein HAX54_023893 [Datura stramonium]|uniref:Uncharacterized protein n=1 Tax=Datura stramonium TaxID=4076 RepID=A0ABS8S7I3_DATST|nr:hypothetical protein [Datura stramonium]
MTHVTRERVCLVFALMTERPINIGQIDEEVAGYRQCYDLKGLDVTKIKDPKGIHGPVLSIIERSMCTNNILSHLYGMQMLQLRMSNVIEEQLNTDYPLSEHSRALYRVGLGFKELFDDDDATDEEQARVDSNLESDDNGDDSEMGEATFALTDDED